MSKPWVRLYRNALNNPKVGRLTLEERGLWVSLLMLSDDEGKLPSEEDIAWSARVTESEVRQVMLSLVSHGLVTRDGHGLSLHDWFEHQYASDADPTAAERKRRQREREKAQKSAVTRDVTAGHANVTRTDTDTDTDTEEEKKKEEREEARKLVSASSPDPEIQPSKSKPEKTRGSRWPADAIVPDDWISEGEAYRETAGLQFIDLRAEALKFANYWASKSGGGATKIDWKRTWLNWCLTAKGTQNGTGRTEHKSLASEVFGGLYAEARAARENGRN